MRNESQAFILTIKQIQSLSENDKRDICSYINVSEKVKKITENFTIIMNDDKTKLLQKGFTTPDTPINISSLLVQLPYPTNSALEKILKKLL